MSDDAEHIATFNQILRVVVGSTAHGTNIPGTSDRDEMGVCVPPRSHVIGLDTFDQWVHKTAGDGARSGPDDVDATVYSLAKYVRLAAEGNPSVLATLWTPVQHVVEASAEGGRLLESRDLFVSRQAGRKFLGYLQSQRDKALGLRGNRTHRPELVDQFGRDVKFEYHMVRLAYQGVELLTTGGIALPMPEAIRGVLLDIRQGRRTQEESLAMAAEFEAQLKTLVDCNYIPAVVDRAAVNDLLVNLHESFWRSQGEHW